MDFSTLTLCQCTVGSSALGMYVGARGVWHSNPKHQLSEHHHSKFWGTEPILGAWKCFHLKSSSVPDWWWETRNYTVHWTGCGVVTLLHSHSPHHVTKGSHGWSMDVVIRELESFWGSQSSERTWGRLWGDERWTSSKQNTVPCSWVQKYCVAQRARLSHNINSLPLC